MKRILIPFIVLALLLLCGCGASGRQDATPSSTVTSLSPTALPVVIPPVDTEEPLPPSDVSTWNLYHNAEYGFSFHYPDDRWTLLSEDRQLLLLYRDTGIALRVKFARQDEEGADLRLYDGAAEDLVAQGTVRFVGEEVERSALIYEDLVYWVFYNAAAPIPRGDLLFSLALVSDRNYEAGESAVVPEDVQAEAEGILEMFVLD